MIKLMVILGSMDKPQGSRISLKIQACLDGSLVVWWRQQQSKPSIPNILYMEIQALNRPYFDPYNSSIKQINSLDIIEPSYLVASSFLLTDSQQHLSSANSHNQPFELTPVKKQHESVLNELRFGKYQEPKHPLEISYSLEVARPSPPSIENILMQNQRKQHIQHIAARFINKIEDIFNDYPQLCSLEINTGQLQQHHPEVPPLTSNTSLTDPQQQTALSPNICQPSAILGSIQFKREQRRGSGQDTKWSEDAEVDDHSFMQRQDLEARFKTQKQKSYKLQQVLKFVNKWRSGGRGGNEDVDIQTLRSCLGLLQRG